MYIKIDGTVFNFCKNKCHKNLIELKRIPRRTSWTQPYMREKTAKMSTSKKKAPKRKKGAPSKKKPSVQKKAAERKSGDVKDKKGMKKNK